MEVRWSVPAAEDLERICEWIERNNMEAARRVAQTIYDGCAPNPVEISGIFHGAQDWP